MHRSISGNSSLGPTRALRRRGAFLGMEAISETIYRDSVHAETPLVLCVASCDRISNMAPAGTATQRVASWLLDRHRMQETTQVPQSVLSELLGMRPETLSRALRRLDNEGLIEVSRSSLYIIDPSGLRQKLPG